MANFYWVGNGGLWSEYATHWATTSGGSTFHTNTPTSADDVYFDDNSFSTTGQTVTIDAFCSCGRLDMSAVTNTPHFTFNYSISIWGNSCKMSGNITATTNGNDIEFKTTLDFYPNGVSGVQFTVYTSTTSQTVTLMGDLTTSGVALLRGILDANDYDITVSNFYYSSLDWGATFDISNSTFNAGRFSAPTANNLNIITNTNTVINITGNFSGSNFDIGGTSGGGKTLNGLLRFMGSGTDKSIDWAGSNTYQNLQIDKDVVLTVTAGTTQTITGDILGQGASAGSGTGAITIQSSVAGTPFTISKSSGKVDVSYWSIKDSIATGGALFNSFVDNGCVNVSGNSGWNFSGIILSGSQILDNIVLSWTDYDEPIYGVSWDKSSTSSLTRTDNAVGMTANAGVDNGTVINNFDTASIYSEIIEVTDDKGNTFIRIPKFYIKKTNSTTKTWQISKYQHDGFYLPWCFWDFDREIELNYVYVGKYAGSLSDGKLKSVSGVHPLDHTNLATFRAYARANNDEIGIAGYQQMDIHIWDILQTLFYVEFATLDAQSIMAGYTTGRTDEGVIAFSETGVNRVILTNANASGFAVDQAVGIGTAYGLGETMVDRIILSIENAPSPNEATHKAITFDGTAVNTTAGHILYNTQYPTGATDNVVASSGSKISNSTGKHPMMYRGIENLYGSQRTLIDGLMFNTYQPWVCKDANNFQNVVTSPYEQLGYTVLEGSNWVTDLGYDDNHPYATLPITSSATYGYFRDTAYIDPGGIRIPWMGGSFVESTAAGLSAMHCWSTGTTGTNIGGRLCKKDLSITGQMLQLSNMVLTNPDFAATTGWTPYYGTISAENNILTITGNGTNTYPNANQNIEGITGHKIYMRCQMLITNDVALYADIRSQGAARITLADPPMNEWFTLSGFHTSTSTGSISCAPSHRYADNATANEKIAQVKEILAIDTTLLPASYQALSDAELKTLLDSILWFKGVVYISI